MGGLAMIFVSFMLAGSSSEVVFCPSVSTQFGLQAARLHQGSVCCAHTRRESSVRRFAFWRRCPPPPPLWKQPRFWVLLMLIVGIVYVVRQKQKRDEMNKEARRRVLEGFKKPSVLPPKK